MKLKKEFITHDSEEGQVMVAAGNAGFSGLVRSRRRPKNRLWRQWHLVMRHPGRFLSEM